MGRQRGLQLFVGLPVIHDTRVAASFFARMSSTGRKLPLGFSVRRLLNDRLNRSSQRSVEFVYCARNLAGVLVF